MTFERFTNHLKIEADLVAKTPIFIGASSDSYKPGEVNGACVKDAYGNPYIPGSSLKGVLRAFLSAVLPNAKDEPMESVVNKNFENKEKRDAEVQKYMQDNNIETATEVEKQKFLASCIWEASTDIERLFGSMVMAGRVKIADAILTDTNMKTEIRNGVAIDRDTHTAINGALFDSEVVPSGTVFGFRASADNLTTDLAESFGGLMQYFADGNITVGGRSRAGFGEIELANVTITVTTAKDGKLQPAEPQNVANDKIKEVILECLKN